MLVNLDWGACKLGLGCLLKDWVACQRTGLLVKGLGCSSKDGGARQRTGCSSKDGVPVQGQG